MIHSTTTIWSSAAISPSAYSEITSKYNYCFSCYFNLFLKSILLLQQYNNDKANNALKYTTKQR